jgi:hypothetical protein
MARNTENGCGDLIAFCRAAKDSAMETRDEAAEQVARSRAAVEQARRLVDESQRRRASSEHVSRRWLTGDLW